MVAQNFPQSCMQEVSGGVVGGISEALITTQLGLAVAIPVLVAAALLSRKAQRIASDMEEKAVAMSAALIQEGSES